MRKLSHVDMGLFLVLKKKKKMGRFPVKIFTIFSAVVTER